MDIVKEDHGFSEKEKVKITQSEEYKQKMIEALWLHYYNHTLFAKGVISERNYIKMKLLILQREPRGSFRKETAYGLPEGTKSPPEKKEQG